MKMIFSLLFLLFIYQAMVSTPFDTSTEITSFILEKEIIQWTTSREVDNKAFMIESSIDGKNWIMVNYQEGERYSDIERQYSFALEQPKVTTYFRLKREDMEGTKQTYEKVLIYKVKKVPPFLKYTVDGTKVSFKTNDGKINVSILDALGNEEHQVYTKDGDTIELNEGVHFIKMTSAHQNLFEQVKIEQID
ncbi:hypothetical protein [Flammeovirga sp. OC4]|uniref:hypothetical protein n=1 Tax=Flammeovirga sp. OC4 TaxID=1382345 RepID=UPI0012DFF127|nr:hypothetical protein [Flammeovirga sp. OC4]